MKRYYSSSKEGGIILIEIIIENKGTSFYVTLHYRPFKEFIALKLFDKSYFMKLSDFKYILLTPPCSLRSVIKQIA